MKSPQGLELGTPILNSVLEIVLSSNFSIKTTPVWELDVWFQAKAADLASSARVWGTPGPEVQNERVQRKQW